MEPDETNECPNPCERCYGQGWYPDLDKWTGGEIQVQCPFCYGTGVVLQ